MRYRSGDKDRIEVIINSQVQIINIYNFILFFSELKKRNIPIVVIGDDKLMQVQIKAYNIRIMTRQRFIPGKLMPTAKKYGVKLEDIKFLPIM